MAPPTSIDGTRVKEITADGDVVFRAIPDPENEDVKSVLNTISYILTSDSRFK